MTRITILILAGLLSATTGYDPTYDPAEDHEPNLCDLAEGRYCITCGTADTVGCDPQDDDGWLCCAHGVCVAVASIDEDCSGDIGWCNDYYTETLANGIEIATCEG